MTLSTKDISEVFELYIENLKKTEQNYKDNGSYPDYEGFTRLGDDLFHDEEDDIYYLFVSFDGTFDVDEEEDAFPDEQADFFRTDNNIPETHSSYELNRKLLQNDGSFFSRDLYHSFGVGVVSYSR